MRPIYNLKESVLYNSQTQKLPFILDAFYLSVGRDSNPLNAREQVLKYQTFAIKLLVYIYIYFCCRWKRMLYYILILNFKFVPIWPNLSFPCLKRTDISCQPTEDGHEELQLDFAVPLFHHKEGHSLRMINGTIQLTQLDGYYIHHHQVHISAGKKTEPDVHINRMEMKSVYKIMRPMFRRTKAIRRFSGRPIWWKVKT